MKISENYKSFAKAYKIYQDMLNKGEILPIKEMDDLGKYFGKRGKPLQRELRSQKARKDFNEKLKKYNKKFHTGGKNRLKKEASKQDTRAEKAAATVSAKLEASTGGKFKISAAQALQRQKSAMKAFGSATIQDLRDRLNLGSDIIQYLAVEKGFTEKQINEYLESMKAQYDMLPEEAKKIADTDVIRDAMKLLADEFGEDNISGALYAYILGQEAGVDDVDIISAMEYYRNNFEGTGTTISDFLDELQDYEEWSEKNFDEIKSTLTEESEV